jgi:hypothetical protein
MKAKTTVVMLVALSLLVVGCIGGDDGGDDVTKEEFIEAADAICADYTEQIDAVTADLPADTSIEAAAEVLVDDALPLLRAQIDELRELDLPADDADELEQLWDDLDAETDRLEAALEDDPESALVEDTFVDENAFAEEYGMQECGGE